MGKALKERQHKSWNNVLVHILLWGVIFILPYFFTNTEQLFNWKPFLRSLPEMLGIMFVFYINYFILIEKLLFKGRSKEYIIYNILLIIVIAFLMYYGRGWLESIMPELRPRRRRRAGAGHETETGQREAGRHQRLPP